MGGQRPLGVESISFETMDPIQMSWASLNSGEPNDFEKYLLEQLFMPDSRENHK